jgi:hypothetical protein
MFLCAVARPRLDAAGNCTLNSFNHARGTLETKLINVNYGLSGLFFNKLITTIKCVFPCHHVINKVNIQHGNEPSHLPMMLRTGLI